MNLSLSACRHEILQNALAVASSCLKRQGIEFKYATTLTEAMANETKLSKYIATHSNIVLAASVWMQNHQFFDNVDIADMAKKVGAFIFKQADDSFYDQGDLDIALALYQLAAGLDQNNEKYLSAVIAPCIQGDSLYPEVALSYAIRVAEINPERDETALVEKLIALKQSKTH